MSDCALKQGDLEPPLGITLIDTNNVPVDLTTALSVMFRMAPYDTRVEIFSHPTTIEDAEAGEFTYFWQQGDTDVPGVYYCEFVVEWPGPRDQTFPTIGYLVISIEPKL